MYNMRDPPTAGHTFVCKTTYLLSCHLDWSGMAAYNKDYADLSTACKTAEATLRKLARLLHFLQVPNYKKEQVFANFIKKLPTTAKRNDAIINFGRFSQHNSAFRFPED